MHLSAVETFLHRYLTSEPSMVFAALPTGYGKFLCFALLQVIGRTAWPAALDNLRRSLLSLTQLPQQRHSMLASIVSRPRVLTRPLCGFM